MRNYQKKYKAIWTNIENLKNIKLFALPVYDDRFIKTKIRTYSDKVYTNFRGLNVPEDDIECESFTVISISICHYWFFNHGFIFQGYEYNGCHDLIMVSVNISDIAIITVKNVGYPCIIHKINKSEVVNLLKRGGSGTAKTSKTNPPITKCNDWNP